jgi:hypothetical protein
MDVSSLAQDDKSIEKLKVRMIKKSDLFMLDLFIYQLRNTISKEILYTIKLAKATMYG